MSATLYVGNPPGNTDYVFVPLRLVSADWRRLPLRYDGHPVFALFAGDRALDVAAEDVQLGKLIPIAPEVEPCYLLAAAVFARLA